MGEGETEGGGGEQKREGYCALKSASLISAGSRHSDLSKVFTTGSINCK